MSQFNDTLNSMVSRVLQSKPNSQQSEVVRQINGRIRDAIAARIYWSDLLVRRIISFPNPYITGTVSTTTGSLLIAGSATSWPVSDIVNTTSSTAVNDFGYIEITPASMVGIKVDTLLYVDAGTAPETVAVIEVTPTSFWARFQLSHATSFTITSSSLAGLQIRTGSNYPTFTVRSVHSGTTLEIDNPWGGPGLTGVAYQILLIYVGIDPNLKVILSVLDQQIGRPLEIYYPFEKLDLVDPQRTATGDPLCLAQYSPTEAGTMQYEVYPQVTTARQLYCVVGLQWPEMKYDTDRPPFFMDPNMFVAGAIADSLRIKNIRMASDVDPWFNPDLAMQYEAIYQKKLSESVNAEQAKSQRDYTNKDIGLLGFGSGNYWVNHSPDLSQWDL